jgi:hypothetical protein
MPVPRLHLFELEDQPWFPGVLRDLATDYLHFMEAAFSLHRPVVAPLAEALRAAGEDRVVDLCSGGGGPVPALRGDLAAEGLAVTFILTDRFPNLPAFERVAAASGGGVTFVAGSVDAKAVPRDLPGFRTMFNSFHHFSPADAVAVLRDAAASGRSIGVFEVPDRRLAMLLATLLLIPLMVAAATPFIRPFRWRRLFWTYALPLVPLTCWWDGVVSMLRAYTPEELSRLASQVAGGGRPVPLAGRAGDRRVRPRGNVPDRATDRRPGTGHLTVQRRMAFYGRPGRRPLAHRRR